MEKKTNRQFRREFGISLQIAMKVIHLVRAGVPNKWKFRFYDLEHMLKQKVLRKRFSPLLPAMVKKYCADYNSSRSIVVPKIIWMFWWQGNQHEIPLVDACISSIEEQKPSEAELVILTKENLRKYCKIPEILYEKLDSGIITLTHFSDIVRVSVLAEHGGLWLDATVYAVGSFHYAFELPFWSIKKPSITHKYIPKGRWSIYAIGAQEQSLVFFLMREMFFAYWESYTCMLDYFLVDYCLDLLYEQIDEVRCLIDSIPENNPRILDFQQNLGMVYTSDLYDGLISDTQLFKLSWKKQVPTEIEGKQTLLGWLLKNSKNR